MIDWLDVLKSRSLIVWLDWLDWLRPTREVVGFAVAAITRYFFGVEVSNQYTKKNPNNAVYTYIYTKKPHDRAITAAIRIQQKKIS